MTKLIESPLNPQKKISLNIDTTMLDLVKELAELTNTNNTLSINTLLVYSLAPLTKTFKTSWITFLGDAKDEQRLIGKIIIHDLQKLMLSDTISV